MTRVGRTAYMRNLGGGGGGNMKTHVAVYEEGLFDLRGGQMPPLTPPKRNPAYMY